jgi:hypothetical protein
MPRGQANLAKSDFDLIADALKHYSKKILELQDDEEIKQGNSLLRIDVKKNSDKALEIAQHLTELRSNNTIKDYPEIICSALTMYQRDLEQSKQKLIEKLGQNVHFEWASMEGELRQIQVVKKYVGCPNHQ